MRRFAILAIAVTAMLAVAGCESVETPASAFPTVRCPVYEGVPDCPAGVPN